MDYPIWNLTIGGGMLMAIVAISHVIVSHFAIGGGLVIAVTETLSVRRNDHELRELARRSSLVLILFSTVYGAISGVGIWVVAGLISPAGISSLIHNYVWGWAIEWVFFLLEIVAALVYYATWDKISKRAHLLVGWLYFIGAYLSLVIIHGIVTYMLTPGRWLETHEFWHGFFNPTYWPGLVLRTGICVLMATGFLVFAAHRADAEARPRLIRYLGWWAVAGALISYLGYRWWEAALPETVRANFAAGNPLISGLDFTRSLTLWALAVALFLAVVFLLAMPRTARVPVAVLFALASFTFFGSYERLREAVRKPFLIHSYMFSNGLLVDQIEQVNDSGMSAVSGWVAARAEEGAEAMGEQIFRAQCDSCHTLDGYLAMRELLPSFGDLRAVAADDPTAPAAATFASECASCHDDLSAEEMGELLPSVDEIDGDPGMIHDLNEGMINASLQRLHDLGQTYAELAPGEMATPAEYDIPYMPPLVGNDEDMEALAEYLAGLVAPAAAGSGGV